MEEREKTYAIPFELLTISKRLWLGCGIVFLISWSIASFLWFQVDLDKMILFSLNYTNLGNHYVLLSQFFTRYGMPVMIFIYLCYLLLSFKIDSLSIGRQLFLLVLFSFAVAGISGDILKEIFNRTRPVITYADQLQGLTTAKSPAFPSGHATKSVAIALPFLFFAAYKGRVHLVIKLIVGAIAFLVCLLRIVLGAHYLSDVLAGFGWAFLCLPVAVVLSNRLMRNFTSAKFERATKIWILVYIGFIIFLILM